MASKFQTRTYSEDDRKLFSQYIFARAAYRPEGCGDREHCWVVEGPPAYCREGKTGTCLGCGVRIKLGR